MLKDLKSSLHILYYKLLLLAYHAVPPIDSLVKVLDGPVRLVHIEVLHDGRVHGLLGRGEEVAEGGVALVLRVDPLVLHLDRALLHAVYLGDRKYHLQSSWI